MQENPLQPPNSTENKATAQHTYAEDMARMMRADEASVIKVALAEQKRREQEAAKLRNKQQKGRNWLFVLGSIALIVAAIYALQFIDQKTEVDSVHPQLASQFTTLIPSDTQTMIPSDSFYSENDIAQALTAARAVPGTPGSVQALIFTKGTGSAETILGSKEFLQLIGSSIPSSLENTLAEPMMIGIYTDTSATPQAHTFFIFQVNEYDNAYAGSILWERTLLTEFAPLFGIDVSGANASLLQKPFDNGLFNNRNVRVLNDENGNPVLYSVFIDTGFYMITDSSDAITEMTNRVHTMNTKPL